MKYILILNMLLVLASCQLTDKNDEINEEVNTDLIDNENPPVMTFEEEEYTFGEVIMGEKVKHIFEFTNTGKSNLIIHSVKATCGCTVPKNWPKKPIAPGETGKIEVVYDSAIGGGGKKSKRVSIVANTNPPQTYLYLKGNVLEAEANK